MRCLIIWHRHLETGVHPFHVSEIFEGSPKQLANHLNGSAPKWSRDEEERVVDTNYIPHQVLLIPE